MELSLVLRLLENFKCSEEKHKARIEPRPKDISDQDGKRFLFRVDGNFDRFVFFQKFPDEFPSFRCLVRRVLSRTIPQMVTGTLAESGNTGKLLRKIGYRNRRHCR